MNHLHIPERLSGESSPAYRKRRAASHAAARQVNVLVPWPEQHRCHPDRSARRQAMRIVGRRQYLRLQKLALREINLPDWELT